MLLRDAVKNVDMLPILELSAASITFPDVCSIIIRVTAASSATGEGNSAFQADTVGTDIGFRDVQPAR